MGLSLEQSLLSTGEGLQNVNENFDIFLACFTVLLSCSCSMPLVVGGDYDLSEEEFCLEEMMLS